MVTAMNSVGMTLQGVFGIARTIFVDECTQRVSWAIVTPARILMRSLSASASFIPCSFNIAWATCGLQLYDDNDKSKQHLMLDCPTKELPRRPDAQSLDSVQRLLRWDGLKT